MANRSHRIGLAFLVAVIIGLGLWNITATWGQGSSRLFGPLFQAYDRIKASFYPHGKVDEQELLYGAIQGMVEKLDDPYSRFLTPKQYQRFTSIDLNGEFVGVGVQITVREGQLLVITPLRGSPAELAGIRAGDIILEIDERSTEGITLDEAVELLRGERGTSVNLKVQHVDGTVEEIMIVRQLIELDPVEYHLEGERIGYLRITTFNRKAAEEANQALDELTDRERIEGLVLDLRNNPGGLLEEAASVAGKFVDRGPIFNVTDGSGTEPYLTRGNDLPNLPIAVLINQGTASAAEILAGAIQDHQMGILVGERSFGKGVIQTAYPLSDGSGVIITTAEYTTPNGHRVQDLGLVPDITVMNEGEEDRQLQAARQWVKEHLGSLCPCPVPHDRSSPALLPLSPQG
jgi:carboxyl-terminal processing protease